MSDLSRHQFYDPNTRDKMKITESGIYADINEIADELEIALGINATLPNLTSVGGSVSVRGGSKLSVPNLTSVGGYVDVWENAKLSVPNLTSIGGSVSVGENAKLTVPNLTSIGGGVSVGENAKLSVPNLTSIGGFVSVWEHAKLSVPNLTSVGGYVDVWEHAKLSVPNLTSIGGPVSVRWDSKLIRSKTEITYDRSMLERSFNASGYTFVDRILAKIVHTRGNVKKIIIAGQSEISYLVSDGEHHAHGKTLKQAQDDLRFKKIAEKLKTEPIKADTIITVMYYRTVTGSCETGVKQWIDATFDEAQKSDILKNGIRADKLLPILKAKRAYGFERFQSLVEFA